MRPAGSIRQRSANSFEIRYNLGTDPLTGKRKRIYKTFSGSYEGAKKELRRLLRTLDTGEHVQPTKLKVGEYLLQWLDAINSQISPKTYERYSELVDHYLIPSFGACALTSLDPSSIQNAYTKWEKSGRWDGKKGGLSPRTRLHIHRVLRLALKHAVRMRLTGFNPADAVIPPRAKKATVATLTADQSATLLEALRSTRLYWPVLLALTTGMRRGEIVALRWKNVDFEKKMVRVIESVEQVKQNLRFKAPKTERTRAIMLPDYALNELKVWKERQTKELARLGVTATNDTFVCGRSWDGGVIKPDSLTGQFREKVKGLKNIPLVRFHDLRHSHATQLLSEGVHPKIAQERLGHSTITTTLDLYSHAADTMQNDAAQKLDLAFRSVIKARAKNDPQPS